MSSCLLLAFFSCIPAAGATMRGGDASEGSKEVSQMESTPPAAQGYRHKATGHGRARQPSYDTK